MVLPDYPATIMPWVRAENPGIVFHHAGRCRETADTYRIVEAYADQSAMDAMSPAPPRQLCWRA